MRFGLGSAGLFGPQTARQNRKGRTSVEMEELIRWQVSRHLAEPRFWLKVDRRGPEECWLWTAGKTSKGYGVFYVSGRNVAASVFSWELHTMAPVPKGLFVCHSCDTPACVNTRCLWLGTPLQNAQDCFRKDRGADRHRSSSGASRRWGPKEDRRPSRLRLES